MLKKVIYIFQFNFLILLFVLFLSGCSFEGCGFSSEKIITRNWASSKEQPIPKLYCYQTLGDYMCYAKPKIGKEHLLVGQHISSNQLPEQEIACTLSSRLDGNKARKDCIVPKTTKKNISVTEIP